jgi:hypothetical protein
MNYFTKLTRNGIQIRADIIIEAVKVNISRSISLVIENTSSPKIQPTNTGSPKRAKRIRSMGVRIIANIVFSIFFIVRSRGFEPP